MLKSHDLYQKVHAISGVWIINWTKVSSVGVSEQGIILDTVVIH